MGTPTRHHLRDACIRRRCSVLDDRFDAYARSAHPGRRLGRRPRRRARPRRRRGTTRDGEDRPPDADSVFRIASMTKSLHRRGDPAAARRGPAAPRRPGRDVRAGARRLARRPPPTAGPVTIRHLLTMSAGLPTDDPWGDRQQGLPLDRFADCSGRALVRVAAGHAFEYSNLGYGILGRVDHERRRRRVPRGRAGASAASRSA